MKITKKQIDRYSRQIILKKIGIIGQKKILNAKVLIIGAGGLGSPIAIYLAALGVGNIGIVDKDKVEISNLNRQIIFEDKDIKKRKSAVAATKIKKINPDIKVRHYQANLNKINIHKIAIKYDFIIDGSDNFRTRFLINDYCLKNKKVLISSAISKYDGQIFNFDFRKKGPCLRCFMPSEPTDAENCESEGIMSTLAGIAGSLQANEVIKSILKIGKPLNGEIMIFNSLNLNFRKIKLKKNINCKNHFNA